MQSLLVQTLIGIWQRPTGYRAGFQSGVQYGLVFELVWPACYRFVIDQQTIGDGIIKLGN
jgi:hypothetical protein